MLDINYYKKTISDLSGYKISEKQYTFYYDETNNYRKITIRETNINNINAYINDYILGGFCHISSIQPNINKLFDNELKKFKSIELKSKSIYNCSFLNCLKKDETKPILEWIKNNGYIHYTIFNCFYDTVIDIVDSIFDTEIGRQIPKDYSDICKSQLFLLLYKSKEEFIGIANQVNYPNIEKENVKTFCDWLINLIENDNADANFYLEIFRQLVKSNRNKDSLVFLTNNEEKTLVNGFSPLRQQKCIIFDNSHHIFDNEHFDEEKMKSIPITKENNIPYINYEFVDSKNNRFIQLSDAIIKLIFKFLNYIDTTPITIIRENMLTLSPIQKDNLILLISLIDSSDEEDKFFLAATIAVNIQIARGQKIDYIKQLLKISQ